MNARIASLGCGSPRGCGAASWPSPPTPAPSTTSSAGSTFLVFGVIIGFTMYVTYLAAKRVKSASQFYAAGRSVSGIQNGWAIAGDYLSAASFLGIAGLISLYGYDGFMYSVGWLVAYITVLLVIAEPCRNIGKYTLGDILAFRNDPKKAKTVAAISTIVVSIFYLTAQMVGGGVLVKTLVGIDYEVSVIVVGVLMLAYVLFGGMVATTWVQIIKAILLVTASILLVIFTWAPYGFSLPGFLQAAVDSANVQGQVSRLIGDAAKNMTPQELGQRFLEPGLFLKNPIDQISLGMALVLGTAGMPHILMRFFTVPTAKDARVSVIWAMGIIGGFYVLTLFLGLGSAINVGQAEITRIDKGGNMAGPLLAQFLGGGAESMLGNLFLAFVAAVAFATIVAVVAGLVLASASAMSHDIWVGVVKGEHATQEEEVRGGPHLFDHRRHRGHHHRHPGQGPERRASRGTRVRGRGIEQPALRALTLYWRKCNTGGIVAGMIVGAVSAIALVLVSPNMTYPVIVKAAQEEIIEGADEKLVALNSDLGAPTDPAARKSSRPGSRPRRRRRRRRRTPSRSSADATTSIVGLEQAAVRPEESGLISIPLGFLAVIIGRSSIGIGAPTTCGTNCTCARTPGSTRRLASAH